MPDHSASPRVLAPRLVAAILALACTAGACGAAAPSTPTATATVASPSPASTGASSLAPGATPSPTASAVPAPTPTASPEPVTPLVQAMRYVGHDPTQVTFTDWASLKRAHGAQALTGASDAEAKVRAIASEAPLSGSWFTDVRQHATDWGFDAFDLAWEASAAGESGIVNVFRFDQPTVAAGFAQRLDDLGFTRETLANGDLRTGSLATMGGVSRPNPSFFATGFLPDGVTVIASGTEDAVRAVLSDGPRDPGADGLLAAATTLGSPSVAAILLDDPCVSITQYLTTTPRPGGEPSFADQLAAAGPLGHPDALGLGYAHGDAITARAVVAYGAAGSAQADLAGRASLMRDGSGVLDPRQPQMRLADARVEGPVIVLDLLPPDGATAGAADVFARHVIQAVTTRDLVFGACTF